MERDTTEVDIGPTPNILKEEYLDIYEGIQSEIVSTMRFDEDSDLRTTYLGKSDRAKNENSKQRSLSHIRARVYIRKTVRWNGMLITVR